MHLLNAKKRGGAGTRNQRRAADEIRTWAGLLGLRSDNGRKKKRRGSRVRLAHEEKDISYLGLSRVLEICTKDKRRYLVKIYSLGRCVVYADSL